MILYHSPECTGYAKLDQALKYMTMMYKLSPMQGLGNEFDHVIKVVMVNPVSSFEQIW